MRGRVAWALALGIGVLGGSAWAEPPGPVEPPEPAELAPEAAPEVAPVAPIDPRLAAENAEVLRLAAANEGGLARLDDDLDGAEARALAGAALQMVLVLGAVCLLAYLLLGKVLPRVLKVPLPGSQPRLMRVVDRLPIDQRRSILLVAVGDDYFMVGASEGGIHLISRLDAEHIQRAASLDAAPGPSGLARLAGALTGRGKES